MKSIVGSFGSISSVLWAVFTFLFFRYEIEHAIELTTGFGARATIGFPRFLSFTAISLFVLFLSGVSFSLLESRKSLRILGILGVISGISVIFLFLVIGFSTRSSYETVRVSLEYGKRYEFSLPVGSTMMSISTTDTGLGDVTWRLDETRYITIEEFPDETISVSYGTEDAGKSVTVVDSDGDGIPDYRLIRTSNRVEKSTVSGLIWDDN